MRRAAALSLILAVLGFVAGRVTSSSPSPSPPAASQTGETHTYPGPSSETAGVGVGFADSRRGALAAAARYQQAFASKSVLRPGALEERIRTVATPRFAPVMIAANKPGTERLRVGPFGEGVRGEIGSVYFGVPIAYRTLSYSPDRAVIETWGFTVIGNESSVEPIAYFGLSKTTLRWLDGDWKIADTEASFGPTPKLGTRRAGSEVGLVELMEELTPYAVAP